MREGLRQVLQGLDAQVDVLDAPSCAQAFALASEHPDLDVVLLDYHLPDMNGLEALDIFGQKHPELPVIMISGSADPHVVRKVMNRGAAGFVSKAGQAQDLLGIILKVLAGEIHVPGDMLELPSRPAPLVPQSENTPNLLTPRQVEVLHLLIDGLSNKDISRSLSLSEETTKNHVSAIYRVFGVQTRVQAVMAAARHGYARFAPRV